MLVTTQSGATLPPDGKVMLEHVVTVVLKQAKDGPLAKALAHANIEVVVSAYQKGMSLFSHWLMVLRSHFLLVTRACCKPSRSSPTFAK